MSESAADDDPGRAARPALPGVRHGFAQFGDVRIHYVEQGTGPLVVLLHGFPDFWYTWRFQIPALAAAGFRVVAPDLRGYNESSKPPDVASYTVRAVAGDIASLITTLGEERATIVGHDWGGVIAWYMGARMPERVARLAVLNAPHPNALRRELRGRQALRSWYVAFFQIPKLPELLLGRRNHAPLIRTLRKETLRAAAFTAGDAAAYRAAFANPAALRSALNYYRALVRGGRSRGGDTGRQQGPRARNASTQGRAHAPALLLWGDRDPHLGIALTRGLDRWVPRLEVERFPDAGHWVHWDAADAVNTRLLAFLGQPTDAGTRG